MHASSTEPAEALLSCTFSPHHLLIHQLHFCFDSQATYGEFTGRQPQTDDCLLIGVAGDRFRGFEERKKKSGGVKMALKQLWNDQLTINLGVVTITDSLYWPESTGLCEVILYWLSDILSRWMGSCSWKLFFFSLVRSGNNLYGDFLVAWTYRNYEIKCVCVLFLLWWDEIIKHFAFS